MNKIIIFIFGFVTFCEVSCVSKYSSVNEFNNDVAGYASAFTIPIFEDGGELYCLMGQGSGTKKYEFLGGGKEKSDVSFLHSAFRETIEELSIHPKLHSNKALEIVILDALHNPHLIVCQDQLGRSKTIFYVMQLQKNSIKAIVKHFYHRPVFNLKTDYVYAEMCALARMKLKDLVQICRFAKDVIIEKALLDHNNHVVWKKEKIKQDKIRSFSRVIIENSMSDGLFDLENIRNNEVKYIYYSQRHCGKNTKKFFSQCKIRKKE